MKKRAIFVLGILFVFSGFVIAQTKTVTNADLEKFRQNRLKAERDLRENYAELGFPSPEELAKQNEESRKELDQLSDTLREKQIAQESQNRESFYYRQNNQSQPRTNNGFIDYGGYLAPSYYYRTYRNRRYPRNYPNGGNNQKPDFRQRFINGLPDYVLRNHRFNNIYPNRNLNPTPRRATTPRRKRN